MPDILCVDVTSWLSTRSRQHLTADLRHHPVHECRATVRCAMRNPALIAQATASYAAALQKDPANTYAAYRLVENVWDQPRAMVRVALKRLLEVDPWFLTAMHTQGLEYLTIADIEYLTPFVGAGLPAATAARLRAQLWYNARRGSFHPDTAGLIQLQTALSYLLKVPTASRDKDWHQMVVGCYFKLDYAKYKQAFPKLLAATDPEWRSQHINQFLINVAKRQDWVAYDHYRSAWDQLPPHRYCCQCYLNDLYTNDGLRAIAAKNWDAIPAALTNAAAVTGCPHLNTGGLRLTLVEQLVAKRKHLDAARTYLQVATKFESFTGNKQAVALGKKLEAAAKRRR